MQYRNFYSVITDLPSFFEFLCETPINFFLMLSNPYIWIGLGPFIFHVALRVTNDQSEGAEITDYTNQKRNIIFMFVHYYTFLVGLISISIDLILYSVDVHRYSGNFYVSAMILGLAGIFFAGLIGVRALFLDESLLSKYKERPATNFFPPMCTMNALRISLFWIAVYISWMTEYHLELLIQIPTLPTA